MSMFAGILFLKEHSLGGRSWVPNKSLSTISTHVHVLYVMYQSKEFQAECRVISAKCNPSYESPRVNVNH